MTADFHTKYITLIGTPLSQSFAARMQNAAYDAAGINLHYFYTEAGPEHLQEILDGIRCMPSFAGCAVTKPNKVAVLPFLDELDPLCRAMGACNTVVRTPEGFLKGYNTDGLGFLHAFTTETGSAIRGQRFFCLGAGGAARAICFSLAFRSAGQIVVTDCIPSLAEELVRDLNAAFSSASDSDFAADFSRDSAGTHPVAVAAAAGDLSLLPACDAVINATGVGMGSTRGQSPLPPSVFSSFQLAFDACYNPLKTRFLRDAQAAGCRIFNGLGMSLYQGAAQIELWSGCPAPLDIMRRTLLDILAEQGADGSETTL